MEGLELDVLTENRLEFVFHYAPLHYLPFICRTRQLLSKPELTDAGFAASHFRSTSSRQDIRRGFEEYIHITLNPHPPILQAKLTAGFPHFELKIPSRAVEQGEFHLCRFNIAKTRYFRGANREPPECDENGRYYDGKLIPIAKTKRDRATLFAANYGKNMIEVLVPRRLDLPNGTIVTVFSAEDKKIAESVLSAVGTRWLLECVDPDARYKRHESYVRQVTAFIDHSLSNPGWLGNGLEFDRV